MSVPISEPTTPAPDYPAKFFFTNNAYRLGVDVTIGAYLPHAYIAHLTRTQARDLDRKGVEVNQADLNLDAADMSDGRVVNRLIHDYELVATTTMTIKEVSWNPILTYVSLVGTATASFTDDDGKTHTITADCEISLDYTMFVDTPHRSGHGQSLGLSPEQMQEMTNLTTPRSVVTYLNAQCEQAPLVITNREWEIARVL